MSERDQCAVSPDLLNVEVNKQMHCQWGYFHATTRSFRWIGVTAPSWLAPAWNWRWWLKLLVNERRSLWNGLFASSGVEVLGTSLTGRVTESFGRTTILRFSCQSTESTASYDGSLALLSASSFAPSLGVHFCVLIIRRGLITERSLHPAAVNRRRRWPLFGHLH